MQEIDDGKHPNRKCIQFYIVCPKKVRSRSAQSNTSKLWWLLLWWPNSGGFYHRNIIQGVSENTDTFLSLPALVFITPQTLLGARIDLWSLEIHVHGLSSPFEPLPVNKSRWSDCLPFLAKQISALRRTSTITLRHPRAVTALTHSVTEVFSSDGSQGSRL